MDDKKVKILLGKRIKQLRQDLNLTQFVLGEKIDINQRQVAQIESGKSFPSLSTLVKLAKVYNCEIKDLFNYKHLEDERILKDNIINIVSNLDRQESQLLYAIAKVIKET
jgi:transcriptional regulator, XRE family